MPLCPPQIPHTDLRSNLDLRGEKPATDRLSHVIKKDRKDGGRQIEALQSIIIRERGSGYVCSSEESQALPARPSGKVDW